MCFSTFFNASLWANNECADAIELIPSEGSCTYVSTSFSGATFGGNTISCATSASQDIWFKFVATDPVMRIAVEGVRGVNHGFELIENSCGGNLIVCKNATSTNFIDEDYIATNFVVGNTYYIRVFNASSSATTTSFGVCVRKYPQPTNNDCVNATVITPSTTCTNVSGTFSGANLSGAPIACAPAASQDAWFQFVATDSMMQITLASVSGLNHGFEIVEESCNGNVFACVNSANAGVAENYHSANFTPGRTYFVRVYNATDFIVNSTFQLCVRNFPTPNNNYCANAIEIVPNPVCSYVYGTFTGATLNGGAVSCGVNASQDIWFKFRATEASMIINLDGVTGLNHGFEVFAESCTGTAINCTNGYGNGVTEGATLNNLVEGTMYYIRVFNAVSTFSTETVRICVRGAIPVCTPTVEITTASTSICEGENVTFTALGTSTGSNPTYQWFVGGVDMNINATTFTTNDLVNRNTITCVMTSDSFCAVATPTVTSNAITMTVSPVVSSIFAAIDSVCYGEIISLPTTSINGVEGTWSPAFDATQTTTYSFTPNAGQCANAMTLQVAVKAPIDLQYTVDENTITATAIDATFEWLDCNTNTIIAGENNATFTAPYSGDFALVVTQNACSATSNCENIILVGIVENSNEMAVKIMPNPFTTDFTLVANAQDLGATIIVSDIAGRVVYQTKLTSEMQVINLANFANGVYFVQLSTRAQSTKIVKF